MFSTLGEIFRIFLRLGCTSFGGPVAHLGYFHKEFVIKKKWLSDQAYADLVALCQTLPGPASSQVGMAIGLSRGGPWGAILAWLGFTLPSALILLAFAFGLPKFAGSISQGGLHGLKIVAVAVVAQALWVMGRKLCPDLKRRALALAATVLTLALPSALGQLAVIFFGGMVGWLFLNEPEGFPHTPLSGGFRARTGAICLLSFFALLLLLPILAQYTGLHSLKLFDSFFRAGSLVFGGGHVVLPLLQAEVVASGWVSNEVFMAGYGAAQAIPGPLFTFSAYLGAVSRLEPSGWVGAGLCLVAVFLPSFLLILGVLPFWEQLRRLQSLRRTLLGINAAVVGLLLAAFYNPVWVSAVHSPKDLVLALAAFLLLVLWQIPSWAVVVLTVTLGGLWGR